MKIVNYFIKDLLITLKYLLYFYGAIIFIAFVGRAILLIIHYDVFVDNNLSLIDIFLNGIRSDVIVPSYLNIVCAFFYIITFSYIKNIISTLFKLYIYIFFLVVLFLFALTFPFFYEYDVVPNYLFIRYLAYPHEVFSMILTGYKKDLILILIFLAIYTFMYFKFIKKKHFTRLLEINQFKRIIIFIILLPFLFLMARSSLARRGVTPASFIISNRHIINEIVKNPFYSVFYATYSELKHNSTTKDYEYIKMSPQEALSITKKLYGIKNGNKLNITRDIKTHFKTAKRKNLIVFVQESLGAKFVYSITHNIKSTPNLDRLSHDGVFFTNLNAVGTRSIKGLAAMSAGYIPIVGKGVVSLSSTYGTFFTFARLLKPLGYKTSFIYGGEKQFDNMGDYFYSNKFDTIIDQTNYKSPIFIGPWGVSDEDLVKKADKLFTKYHKEGKHFASLMFSSSNHTPFVFPDGRIKLVDPDNKNEASNAVKYADYAIGKFINDAKKHGYYKDSVIVIVADHNVRTKTNDIFPISKYHIPALILGGGVPKIYYDKLSSQPDVFATAIDLLGKDFNYPVFGNSIYNNSKREISFMNYNRIFALRIRDRVVVLEPRHKPKYFIYKEGKKLIPSKPDPKLGKQILALIITAKYMHKNDLYKVDKRR